MEEYYHLTSELDAREILRYLNELGIKNITGEFLKYFITDLKKLIKQDLLDNDSIKSNENPGPERLHSATTFCSRVRSKTQTGENVCMRVLKDPRTLSTRSVQSAPNLGQKENEKPLRRACSCVREKPTIPIQSKSTLCSSNVIKVPIQVQKKKCDPVALYHYYTKLWDKYKSNVPGENNWSEIRWKVRQQMATQDKENLIPKKRDLKTTKKKPSLPNTVK